MRRLWLCVAVVILTGGCVPTARDFEAYEAKAATTAAKMASAVESGQLVAKLASDGQLLGPYASVSSSGAEKEAEAISSTFAAIQPLISDRKLSGRTSW